MNVLQNFALVCTALLFLALISMVFKLEERIDNLEKFYKLVEDYLKNTEGKED